MSVSWKDEEWIVRAGIRGLGPLAGETNPFPRLEVIQLLLLQKATSSEQVRTRRAIRDKIAGVTKELKQGGQLNFIPEDSLNPIKSDVTFLKSDLHDELKSIMGQYAGAKQCGMQPIKSIVKAHCRDFKAWLVDQINARTRALQAPQLLPEIYLPPVLEGLDEGFSALPRGTEAKTEGFSALPPHKGWGSIWSPYTTPTTSVPLPLPLPTAVPGAPVPMCARTTPSFEAREQELLLEISKLRTVNEDLLRQVTDLRNELQRQGDRILTLQAMQGSATMTATWLEGESNPSARAKSQKSTTGESAKSESERVEGVLASPNAKSHVLGKSRSAPDLQKLGVDAKAESEAVTVEKGEPAPEREPSREDTFGAMLGNAPSVPDLSMEEDVRKGLVRMTIGPGIRTYYFNSKGVKKPDKASWLHTKLTRASNYKSRVLRRNTSALDAIIKYFRCG